MHTPAQQLEAIAERLAAESEDITTGKMMSSPGIRYRNKVFAFADREAMVFRFGRDFDLGALGIYDYHLKISVIQQLPCSARGVTASRRRSLRKRRLLRRAICLYSLGML
jgi:hypothetical protein